MNELRGRAQEKVASEDADRLLARFVRNVTRARRAGDGDGDPGARGRKRRSDESTEPVIKNVEETSLSRVATRRLLGQDDPGASMSDEARRTFMVELSALYRHGHIDDVSAEVEAARSRFPADVTLIASLADFFLERKDTRRGVEMLFAMVDAHFERRDPEAARRCLGRVQQIDPENRRLRSFEKLLRPDAGEPRRPSNGATTRGEPDA